MNTDTKFSGGYTCAVQINHINMQYALHIFD